MLKQPAFQYLLFTKTIHKVNQKEPAAMIRQALVNHLFNLQYN